jgi:acetyltransferase
MTGPSLRQHVAPGLSAPMIVRPLGAEEIEERMSDLVALLRESVDNGASLGFLPPLTPDLGVRYWRSLPAEIQAGSRIVVCAFADGRLIGTGGLAFPWWPNAQHRAEVQKVMVAREFRGRGVGEALMLSLHREAQQRGRTLLTLHTRAGDPAETFYLRLGYRITGTIPGFTQGPSGERYDQLMLYQDFRSGETLKGRA